MLGVGDGFGALGCQVQLDEVAGALARGQAPEAGEADQFAVHFRLSHRRLMRPIMPGRRDWPPGPGFGRRRGGFPIGGVTR